MLSLDFLYGIIIALFIQVISGTAIPSAGNGTASNNLATFNPPSLALQSQQEGQSITVTLNGAPTGNVVITIETSENVRTDKCQLVFTSANFSQPQTITVFASGTLLSTTAQSTSDETLTMSMFSCDTSYDKKTLTYDIQRQTTSAKTCTSIGDPHYTTFDNSTYTFFGQPGNSYYIFKSDITSVEATHIKCDPTNFCNGNVAIRHLDSVVIMTLNTNASAAEPQFQVNSFGSNNHLTIVSSQEPVKIQTADGVVLTITFQFWDNVWLSNINLVVPGFYSGNANGLCGDMDGSPDTIDGNTFIVPDADNIFNLKEKCSGAANIPTSVPCDCVKSVPQLPTCGNNSTTTTPGLLTSTTNGASSLTNNSTQSTSSAQNPSKTSSTGVSTTTSSTTTTPTQTQIVNFHHPKVNITPPANGEHVENFCTRVFGKLKCDKVNAEFYVNACIEDGKLVKDFFSLAEFLMNTFMAECSTNAALLNNSPRAEDKAASQELVNIYSFVNVSVTVTVNVNAGQVIGQQTPTLPPQSPSTSNVVSLNSIIIKVQASVNINLRITGSSGADSGSSGSNSQVQAGAGVKAGANGSSTGSNSGSPFKSNGSSSGSNSAAGSNGSSLQSNSGSGSKASSRRSNARSEAVANSPPSGNSISGSPETGNQGQVGDINANSPGTGSGNQGQVDDANANSPGTGSGNQGQVGDTNANTPGTGSSGSGNQGQVQDANGLNNFGAERLPNDGPMTQLNTVYNCGAGTGRVCSKNVRCFCLDVTKIRPQLLRLLRPFMIRPILSTPTNGTGSTETEYGSSVATPIHSGYDDDTSASADASATANIISGLRGSRNLRR